MIKAIMGNEGSDDRTLLLGLSRGNCDLLLEGKPILIDLAQMEQTGGSKVSQIVLVAGETEEAITDEMKTHLGEAWTEAMRAGRITGVSE